MLDEILIISENIKKITEPRIWIDDAVFEDKMAYPNFDFLTL